MFAVDPTKPAAKPIPAATVILCREATGGKVEVFLLRRHRKSSFMSDAYVFPGGKVEPADRNDEEAAIRELFEEAGVLLTKPGLSNAKMHAWRKRLNASETGFSDLCAGENVEPDFARLHYWARWITPSVEPKRLDARFFLAELPPGQVPSFDDKETVDELWISPAAALAKHAGGTLKLPPPQVKTMVELVSAGGTMADLRVASAARKEHPHAVMPRFAQLGAQMALLLPWDPEYESAGVGEALPISPQHPLAVEDSRFLLEGMSWRLVPASKSANAG